MDVTRPSPLARTPGEASSAQLARAALRRLAAERLEPTPENYERAYRREAGATVAPAGLPLPARRLVERLASRAFDGDASTLTPTLVEAFAAARYEDAERVLDSAEGDESRALATLMERIVRGIERSGHQWTTARRKEGIARVINSSRNDGRRLQQRLQQLMTSWDDDAVAENAAGAAEPAPVDAAPPAVDAARPESLSVAVDPPAAEPAAPPAWDRVTQALAQVVAGALPRLGGAPHELAVELEHVAERITRDGATGPLADELSVLCKRSERVLQHRHHLFDQLGKLCIELTASLADLAEDESWVKGQCEAMRLKIEEGLTARGVRAVSDMLHHARQRHADLRGDRERARDALKSLISQMLGELDQLGARTGSFHESVGRYAAVIEEADSLESLAGVVREMVADSRSVQSLVQETQARLQSEHSKATGLLDRVTQLENEMRRLSDEVSTDQLTQIANRRGLIQAFEIERAKLERDGGTLAIGLLDIDNFKRLNDELGHSAGDEALKALAARVSSTLRPTDRVARYGGEEFVVLMPQTPCDDGQQILNRLQRSLSGGLFMHKDQHVLVTFSAGVTAYRLDESIEISLERADQALYEAKRTGKNRTCIG